MSEVELEILEAMEETAKTQTHCDCCKEPLGKKIYLRLTKTTYYREIVCKKCNLERERNEMIIGNTLVEALSDITGV